MARPGLTGHRKFRRLARALGSTMIARGALELLWDSCYESGEDYVGTAADLEEVVGWAGAAGELAAALVDAGAPEGRGFIEPVDEGQGRPVCYRVHDLWHHAPDYVAKRRRRELDRLAKVDPATERRESDRRTADTERRFSQISDYQIGVDFPPSPSHSPSPSHVEKSVSAATNEPWLMEFPVIGRGGSEWKLTQAQVDEWGQLFQGLNVGAECRKALAWVKADKGRRKTSSGMQRFLVGWFTRAVNSGAARTTGARVTAQQYRASQCSIVEGPTERDLEAMAEYERQYGKAAS